jgi:tetratricopeptide (TPR) repeat protein
MELAEAASLLAEGPGALRSQLGQISEPRQKAMLRAVSAIYEGQLGKVEGALRGFEGDEVLLLRARAAFEQGAGDSARALLDRIEDRAGERWLQLHCAVELLRLSRGAPEGLDWSRLARLWEQMSALSGLERWPGRAPLEGILRLRAALEGSPQSAPLTGVRLVEALLVLAEEAQRWPLAFVELRGSLLLAAGERLLGQGRRDEARERIKMSLKLDGESVVPYDWVTWGRFLKRLGDREDLIIDAFRRAYSSWQAQHASEPISRCPQVALELARVYAEYGYLVEARALLFAFYELGLRDEPLRELLRKVILQESLGGVEPRAPSVIRVRRPELSPAPIVVDREGLRPALLEGGDRLRAARRARRRADPHGGHDPQGCAAVAGL